MMGNNGRGIGQCKVLSVEQQLDFQRGCLASRPRLVTVNATVATGRTRRAGSEAETEAGSGTRGLMKGQGGERELLFF